MTTKLDFQLLLTLIISLLISFTCSLTLDSLIREKCPPGSHSCHVQLSENTTYEIIRPIKMANLRSITIEGHSNTYITCPQVNQRTYSNYSLIHFEDVTNVSLEGIRIDNCFIRNESSPFWSIFSFTNSSMSRIVNLQVHNFNQNAIIYRNVLSAQIIGSSFSNCRSGRAVFFETFSTASSIKFETINTNFNNIHFPASRNNYLNLHTYGGGAGIMFLLLGEILTSHINILASNFTSCSALLGSAVFVHTGHNRSGNHYILMEKSRFINNGNIHSMSGAIETMFLSSVTTLNISECLFQANVGCEGGALSVSHYAREPMIFLHIIRSSFFQNKAYHGGAIFLNGQFYAYSSTHLNLIDSSFENNSANGSGGAIFAVQYVINITRGTFLKNTASFGGALAALRSSINLIAAPKIATIFAGNSASRLGGAIYIASSSNLSSSAIDGTTNGYVYIVNNSAGFNGGGIYDDNIFLDYSGFKRLIKPSWIWQDRKTVDIRQNKVLLSAKYPSICFGNDVYQSILSNSSTSNNQSCNYASRSEYLNVTYKNSIAFRNGKFYNSNENIDKEIAEHIRYEAEKVSKKNGKKLTYIFVRGLSITIEASAFDTLGSNVYTALAFSLRLKRYPGHESDDDDDDDDDFRNDKRTFYHRIFHPRTETNLSFIVPKVNFEPKGEDTKAVRVRACIRMVDSSEYKILGQGRQCVDAIFTACPRGFKLGHDGRCEFNYNLHGLTRIPYDPNNLTPTSNNPSKYKYLINHPGKFMAYISNDTDQKEYKLIPCPGFRCKCQRTSTRENCYFDPWRPSDQCWPGLTGPFCSKCKDGEVAYPPLNIFAFFNGNKPCFECRMPILMIFIYILITLLITMAIMVLKIDIFADYVRTITFYSSSLYIISLTIGFSENSAIKFILTIPIIVMNLVISSLFPFCLPNNESYFDRSLFETGAPFIFVLYILIFILLVKYTSLSTRFGPYIKNIIYPIWTIIILTYSHVCNQAFIIFNCVSISDGNSIWFYDPNIVCFSKKHRIQLFLSILILYTLITFPLFLYIFSYVKKDHNIRHFIEIYDKRYKLPYRNWELFKLTFRFMIGLILLLPTRHSTIILSSVFLAWMCLTAALQPAENRFTNHFEALCFLILALITLPSMNFNPFFFLMMNILALVPFILITLRLGYLFVLRARTWKYDSVRRKLRCLNFR